MSYDRVIVFVMPGAVGQEDTAGTLIVLQKSTLQELGRTAGLGLDGIPPDMGGEHVPVQALIAQRKFTLDRTVLNLSLFALVQDSVEAAQLQAMLRHYNGE